MKFFFVGSLANINSKNLGIFGNAFYKLKGHLPKNDNFKFKYIR